MNPPVRVAAAAARIGVSRRTLFRRFGAIAAKLNLRFQARRHSVKIGKFEDKCALYRESADRLMKRGIRPTQKMVAMDIGGGSTVSQKAYERAACKRICEEVILKGENTLSPLTISGDSQVRMNLVAIPLLMSQFAHRYRRPRKSSPLLKIHESLDDTLRTVQLEGQLVCR